MATPTIAYSKPGLTVSINGQRRIAPPKAQTIPSGGGDGKVLIELDGRLQWVDIEILNNGLRNDDGRYLLNDNGQILQK